MGRPRFLLFSFFWGGGGCRSSYCCIAQISGFCTIATTSCYINTLSVRRFDLILPIYNRVSEVAYWYEECGGMRYIRTVGCPYIIVWYMLIYVVSHEAGGRRYLPLLVYTRTRSCGHSFITHMLCVWLNSISLCLPHVLMSLWNPDRPKAFLQWNVYDWIYSMLMLR